MASAAAAAPQCWVLHYHECVPDVWARIKEQPPEYEQEHLGIARGMLESGKLVAAGAMGDPVDAGLWIFKGVTKEEVESSVVSKDPYVRDGLIKAWTIKPLHVVIGSLDNSQSTTTQSPAGLAATAEASDAEAAPAAAVEARAML